jgi:endonuclease/exonuclease/phosphatase family metal-dependent hydrolase
MKTRRWRWAILLLLLSLAGLVYHGSLHAPTGPAEGVALQGKMPAVPVEPGRLRVGTFNIHAGKGRDGRRDLGRTAEAIASCRLDLVALGEVRGNRLRPERDQAAQLGRRLEMGWLFAPADRVWYCRESGNGLLSSRPARFWQRIPLPRQFDHSRRNVVLLGIEHRDRTIHVLLTHITRGDDRDRRRQLRAVIAMFLALGEPAILLGDMNSDAEDPQIRQLLQTPGVTDPVAEVLHAETPPRIDWIFARGFRSLDAGIHDSGASDHPLVWAEIELLSQAPELDADPQ